MSNTASLSLDRVFSAVGETYGPIQEKDLRYFLGSYGFRDKSSVTLAQEADGSVGALFDIALQSGPMKGILRFSKAGGVDPVLSNNPKKPDFSINTVKTGQPSPQVIRLLTALAFGPDALTTPLSDEEAKFFAGAKALYNNPKPYDQKADLAQKVANQLLFGARIVQLAKAKGDEEEVEAEFLKKAEHLDTHDSSSPVESLDSRAVHSSIMIASMVQTAAGSVACAELGRCVTVVEHPVCSPLQYGGGVRYHYIYRGGEVFSQGTPSCDTKRAERVTIGRF